MNTDEKKGQAKGHIQDARSMKANENQLENEYYKYEEDLRRYANGRINIKHSQLGTLPKGFEEE
jgi:hypothetical protein